MYEKKEEHRDKNFWKKFDDYLIKVVKLSNTMEEACTKMGLKMNQFERHAKRLNIWKENENIKITYIEKSHKDIIKEKNIIKEIDKNTIITISSINKSKAKKGCCNHP